MFAVSPKYDCPHEYHIDHLNFIEYLTANFSRSSITNNPCKKCSSNANFSSDPKSFENWICLTCYEVHCSRFICSHMHQHNREMNSIDEVPTASNLHPIAMSFTDGSFWCYACDSYIYSATFRSISERFGILKHPSSNNNMHPEHPPLPPIEEGEEEERDDLKNYDSSYYEVGSNSLASFTVEELVENMRDNRYLNICFVVGAGISVAAGIPDFRSPGGIYSKIRELNIPDLSTPEALFSLDLLQSRPELFFTLGRDLVKTGYQPVKAHKFISHCASKGIVKMVFSQNIDSLELDAGLSPDLLVQAHGHTRQAHCIACGKEYPPSMVTTAMDQEEVSYCQDCNGIVKPDVVFFGESLPPRFMEHFFDIAEADLVIIMGTSLKVYPFASLLSAMPADTPVVLINREDNADLQQRKNRFLHLGGSIEDNIEDLATKLGLNL